MNLNKLENENELQYIWRICSAKDAGTLEMNWEEIAEVLNKNLREDDEAFTSSAYRKKYQQAKAFYDEVFSKMESQDFQDEYLEQKRQLEQMKIQFRDSRNAWNRQNYAAARVDENLSYLGEKLSEIGKIEFTESNSVDISGDNDVVVCASDWHIGQAFDGIFGTYNSDIAKQRINQLLNETIKIGKRHGSENVYVLLLGDEISGNIHLTVQLANRENLIEQVKLSAELITNFCVELSKHFNRVFLVSCDGNHTRIVAKKEDAVKDERLDSLITWIVSQMTSHINNIVWLQHREIDGSVADVNVRGQNYLLVHGDCDDMNQNSVGKLCMMVGYFPNAIIGGHRHTPAYQEFNGVKYIQSGSLAGSGDDYTVSKRLSGKPNQTVLVCDKKGIDAIYNIELT